MSTEKLLRILLLENEGLVRAGFKALLKETVPTACIYEAATYEQAITLLSSVNIDFAFLDFNLTGEHEETGLDVLHYIRLNALDTRAVVLSAYTNEELIYRCLKAGAWGYIPKAMDDIAVFRHALATVLQGQVFLPKAIIGNGRGEFSSSETSHLEIPIIKGRALEVLYYICQGYANAIIAKRMCLADVRRDYVSKLLKQFNVTNRTQLVIEVARLGMVIPTPQSARVLDD